MAGAVVDVVVLVAGDVVLVVLVVLVVGAGIGAVDGVLTTCALLLVVNGFTARADVVGVTSLTGCAGDVVAVPVVADGVVEGMPVDARCGGAAPSRTRLGWLPE